MKGAIMADRVFSIRKFMKITGLGTDCWMLGAARAGRQKRPVQEKPNHYAEMAVQ